MLGRHLSRASPIQNEQYWHFLYFGHLEQQPLTICSSGEIEKAGRNQVCHVPNPCTQGYSTSDCNKGIVDKLDELL